MLSHLGIVILNNDTIAVTMPVDQRNIQPLGLLHGGVLVTRYLCNQGKQK